MKFIFTCRKCEVNEAEKERTTKKLAKMDKFFKDDCEAHITFSKDKHQWYVLEVTIDYKGVFFRSEQKAQDVNTAIDLVVDTLLRQITKNKSKLEKRFHSVNSDIYDNADFSAHKEEDYEIIKSKKFFLKPMDIEEAILQMNMLGHSFFVFKSANDEDVINIVYRRKDGKYGLIEPSKI